MTATLPIRSEYTADEQRELDRAVDIWKRANENLWDFAPFAAAVVGKHREGLTAELARRIGRSVDAVEGYAAGWRLREKILQKYPSRGEEWLDSLYIGHWIAVARKVSSGWITVTDAANYLSLADKEGLSVDELRKRLPSNDRTDSIRMMRSDIKALDRKYLNAPRLNIPADVIRAVRLLRGRLEKATKK